MDGALVLFYAVAVLCCTKTVSAAPYNEVAVFVDYNAFNCTAASGSSSSSSSSSSSGGGSDRMDDEPIVYVYHGPRSGGRTWQYLPMSIVWWNVSLVSGVISSLDDFVVLCVGSFVHCDNSTQALVGQPSLGWCDLDTFYNFRVTGEFNSVLIVPTESVVNRGATSVPGVMIPFCPLYTSIWSAGAPRPPSTFFTASGTNSSAQLASTTASVTEAVPCGGNGRCHVSFSRGHNGWSTLRACVCQGRWEGPECATCQCGANNSNGYCVSTASSDCALQQTTSTSDAWLQNIEGSQIKNPSLWSRGIAIVLVETEWYHTTSSAQNSYVRVNSGNITVASENWQNWNFTDVAPDDPRWGAFNATPYAVAANPTDGSPRWMSAVVPGNLVQLVWYSGAMTDFVHCSTLDQLVPSFDHNRQNNWGQFQCSSDGLNGLYNFASVGGVMQITQSSFSLLEVFEPGCQFGPQNASEPNNELLPCSGHGTCNVDTFFSCRCFGNYSGVACDSCDCQGNAECTPDGSCACPAGYLQCGTVVAHRLSQVCVNIQEDVNNCGACGNDCTHGLSSAIKLARCVHGQCDVIMQPAMEWEVCFGNMSAGGNTESTVAVGCFRGYDFLIVFCCAFPLFIVSTVVFVRIRMTCKRSHKYRQALFLLIALISCLRMSYAVAALIFLGTASTPEDAVHSREFFAATMISLNAYADLFTGFIDVLLTVYWLFVLDRIRVFPRRLLLSVCVGMAVVLTVATIVDYASGTSTFDYTFFTLAILLFFTALMHMSVIVEVLVKFAVLWRSNVLMERRHPGGGGDAHISAEPEVAYQGSMGSFPAIRLGVGGLSPSRPPLRSYDTTAPSDHHPNPSTPSAAERAAVDTLQDNLAAVSAPHVPAHTQRLTGHFVRVTLIAFVCLLCWLVRSIMLLGRATRQPVFVEGALSFRSPTFTLLYLTLLTLFPCVLIAIIFIALSVDVLRAATSPGIADDVTEHPGVQRSAQFRRSRFSKGATGVEQSALLPSEPESNRGE